jgi:hypothetical protein
MQRSSSVAVRDDTVLRPVAPVVPRIQIRYIVASAFKCVRYVPSTLESGRTNSPLGYDLPTVRGSRLFERPFDIGARLSFRLTPDRGGRPDAKSQALPPTFPRFPAFVGLRCEFIAQLIQAKSVSRPRKSGSCWRR